MAAATRIAPRGGRPRGCARRAGGQILEIPTSGRVHHGSLLWGVGAVGPSSPACTHRCLTAPRSGPDETLGRAGRMFHVLSGQRNWPVFVLPGRRWRPCSRIRSPQRRRASEPSRVELPGPPRAGGTGNNSVQEPGAASCAHISPRARQSAPPTARPHAPSPASPSRAGACCATAWSCSKTPAHCCPTAASSHRTGRPAFARRPDAHRD
jgi:hypothetical protein